MHRKSTENSSLETSDSTRAYNTSAVIIANPTSGSYARKGYHMQETMRFLRNAGWKVELRLTEAAGDAGRLAREAVDRNELQTRRAISPGLTFRDYRAITENIQGIDSATPRKRFKPMKVLPKTAQEAPTLRWRLGTPEPVPFADVRDALLRLERRHG